MHAIIGWFIDEERWFEPVMDYAQVEYYVTCTCGRRFPGWNSAIASGLASSHLREANALNSLRALQKELKEVFSMRYCDSCTENPAKKTITPQMASLFRMDPKSKVCPTCFEQMERQVRGTK